MSIGYWTEYVHCLLSLWKEKRKTTKTKTNDLHWPLVDAFLLIQSASDCYVLFFVSVFERKWAWLANSMEVAVTQFLFLFSAEEAGHASLHESRWNSGNSRKFVEIVKRGGIAEVYKNWLEVQKKKWSDFVEIAVSCGNCQEFMFHVHV